MKLVVVVEGGVVTDVLTDSTAAIDFTLLDFDDLESAGIDSYDLDRGVGSADADPELFDKTLKLWKEIQTMHSCMWLRD